MNTDEEYYGYLPEASRDKNEPDPRIPNTFMPDMNSPELWNISVAVRNENCSNLLEIPRKL